MKNIKKWSNFINETVTEHQLNFILDKISNQGIESLSNFEKILLKSYSDQSINVKDEIDKHINKFKTAKNVLNKIPLQVDDNELEKNIGRYIKFKRNKSLGKLANKGMIYEIVAIQKHWGYVNGQYVPDKIGYRVAEVGYNDSFGRVGDTDEIIFVNISGEDAIKINKAIHDSLN